MAWGNPDVYYQPEKFDLVPLGQIDMHEPNYDFDIVAVWRHAPTGELYWARDSGCSCPSPFEDYTSLDKLTKLSPEGYEEFKRETESCYQPGERATLLRKVRDALRRR
jgi:hypothetical protein